MFVYDIYSNTLFDCLSVLKDAKDDFINHIKAPRVFIERILHAYTSTMPEEAGENGDTGVLEDAISCIQDLLHRATRAQDGILQLCGVSDEWRAAEEVCGCMRDMVTMVEDILCHALSGDADLASAHASKELLYQSYKF
ncbi:hypothetical protein M405DRAFT_868455 [Rhizopogon salebrosus TDB-379]|nr:hypothetical protein M405DRAFT_868455 [Rhizopogon salebrosus TDB-379]